MSERQGTWQFWLRWVLAGAAGAAAIAVVLRTAANAVGYAVSDALGPVAGEAALGIVAAGGFMGAIGAAQWLVAARQITWAGRWLLAVAGGGAVGGAMALGVWAALGAAGTGATLAVAAGVTTGLIAFGAVQWLVLRQHATRAGRLALASVVGYVAAIFVGGGLLGSLGGGEILVAGGIGAVHAAVTGATVQAGRPA